MNANRLLVAPTFVLKEEPIRFKELEAVVSAAFGESRSNLRFRLPRR
jgi:hypothetical protein